MINNNKFNDIFNKNPYIQRENNHAESIVEEVETTTNTNTNNKSIFTKKEDKEKKMFYIKLSSIKKIEKISKKYNLNLSEVLDIMIEDFDKY